MTAIATEQTTTTPPAGGKAHVVLALTPLITLSVDCIEGDSPTALASYSQYASQYLATVEQFVARNNVTGLELSGPVELEGADERYRVTMFADVDFTPGSLAEQELRKFESQLAGAEDRSVKADVVARFEAWMTKYVRNRMADYGYRFNLAAEYLPEFGEQY